MRRGSRVESSQICSAPARAFCDRHFLWRLLLLRSSVFPKDRGHHKLPKSHQRHRRPSWTLWNTILMNFPLSCVDRRNPEKVNCIMETALDDQRTIELTSFVESFSTCVSPRSEADAAIDSIVNFFFVSNRSSLNFSKFCIFSSSRRALSASTSFKISSLNGQMLGIWINFCFALFLGSFFDSFSFLRFDSAIFLMIL